jgi:hypothetical protein
VQSVHRYDRHVEVIRAKPSVKPAVISDQKISLPIQTLPSEMGRGRKREATDNYEPIIIMMVASRNTIRRNDKFCASD